MGCHTRAHRHQAAAGLPANTNGTSSYELFCSSCPATGQVGKAVLPYLEADDTVEVIAAARNPKKAASLGIPVVRLDLDQPETIAPPEEHWMELICALGRLSNEENYWRSC